ncbi:MAG: hypothetical protein CME06_01435 [Gemmatimonadetes bacterium]|nr:hypothetical protein [Gemmatimonadota bacterium]
MKSAGRFIRDLATLSTAERRIAWVFFAVAGGGRWLPAAPTMELDEGAVHLSAVAEPPRTKAELLAALEAPLRINHATKEEFRILPGVGETIAERIIELRRERGGFQELEELLEVKGIGEKRFDRIRPFVILATEPAPTLEPEGIEPISTEEVPPEPP